MILWGIVRGRFARRSPEDYCGLGLSLYIYFEQNGLGLYGNAMLMLGSVVGFFFKQLEYAKIVLAFVFIRLDFYTQFVSIILVIICIST
jgi:hypothetical protein